MLDATPPGSDNTDSKPPELVTAEQAAEILGLALRTVKRMQADGILSPVYLKTTGRARRLRFKRSELEARVAAADELSA